MELRRVAPVLVGVVAVTAVIAGIALLGDDSALGGGDGPDARGTGGVDAPAQAPLAEPTDDGTYRCSTIDDADAPRMSVANGFHDEPFELELIEPDGAPLYYTLDGSYPDPIGNAGATSEYDGPLRIEANDGPYPLSAMRSAFDRSVLGQGNASPRVWDLSHGPVTGGTVVRARTADAAADVSPECVGVFFVGRDLVRAELPVMHLTTDPDHLFDHDTGIYVPGRVYQDWLEGDDYDPNGEHQFGEVPANYMERGREWERPAEDDLDNAVVMHHFEAGGEATYSTNLGVRIHGGWTRAFPQKSLRLYARNDYGNRTFDHAFFGDDGPEVHRRLILRNSGNDWEWTLLLDGYVQSLIDHLDVETQAFQPAVLFLNGEYWGIHNIRERYDRHYLEIAHGVDPDNVAIVGGYGPCCEVNTGDEDDDEPYRQLLRDLQEMDPTDDATLAHVEAQVDVDDLIDYLVVQLYISNTDWPQNNLKLWREKVEPDPDLGTTRDGRWRWLVYDTDFVGDIRRDHFHDAFGRMGDLARAAGDDIFADMGVPFLFEQLIQNDRFRQRFATRLADQINTSFRSERTTAELDQLTAMLRDEIELHTQRWGNAAASNWWPADSPDAWWGRIIEVKNFFAERPGIARHQASEHMGLGGSATLEVGTSGAETGHVAVNTVDLVATTPGVDDPAAWTGRYFVDVPVTLRAIAADGYRFVRWDVAPEMASADAGSTAGSGDGSGDGSGAGSGDGSNDAEVLVLHLDADADTSVTAIFEPS